MQRHATASSAVVAWSGSCQRPDRADRGRDVAVVEQRGVGGETLLAHQLLVVQRRRRRRGAGCAASAGPRPPCGSRPWPDSLVCRIAASAFGALRRLPTVPKRCAARPVVSCRVSAAIRLGDVRLDRRSGGPAPRLGSSDVEPAEQLFVLGRSRAAAAPRRSSTAGPVRHIAVKPASNSTSCRVATSAPIAAICSQRATFGCSTGTPTMLISSGARSGLAGGLGRGRAARLVAEAGRHRLTEPVAGRAAQRDQPPRPQAGMVRTVRGQLQVARPAARRSAPAR